MALGLILGVSTAVLDILDDPPYPVPLALFLSEKPPERVLEILKGIFERRGFKTGADAQMTPRSISTAAAIQRGYANLSRCQ